MQDGKFLYQKVYDDLKSQIKEKQLLPNTKLPKEKELCRQYQVSMITVKRA
ncbi:MAG TPA: winged helix-turn-helix domain-containing protein, partial [Candidatus Blautia gallistercoris]|nr:winged helix-turn-helix domain-containing protein [Candidatus Blautia gallistercoris]